MSARPDPWRTLSGEIRKMKEQLRRLSNASPFSGSGWSVIDPGQVMQDGSVTIPSNGLLLVDGGDVVMLNESLVEVFRLGVMAWADRGLTIRREDGTKVFELSRPFASTDAQGLRIYDRVERIIGGDALLSASGFDAPHIPMPFIPTDYTSGATAQATSSGTFVATHEHRGFRQNPALKAQFMAKCSDGTTSADVQVYDVTNATYLGGFNGSPATHAITVPTGTTVFTLFEFSSALQLPGLMSDDMHLEIHARVTAGAGSVTVAPVRTIGSGF